jgi:hypothetical protein
MSTFPHYVTGGTGAACLVGLTSQAEFLLALDFKDYLRN